MEEYRKLQKRKIGDRDLYYLTIPLSWARDYSPGTDFRIKMGPKKLLIEPVEEEVEE